MEEIFLVLTIAFIVFFGIAMKSWYNYNIEKLVVKEYLNEVAATTTITTKRKKSALYDKAMTKIFKYADEFSDVGTRFNFYSESEDVEKWLVQANYPFKLNVARFQGLKIVSMLIGLIIGIVALFLGLPFSQFSIILLPVFGFFFPVIWLRNKAKSRQAQLGYDLPDFLDMISVTLQAGASLDQALYDISRYFEGPIEEEFSRFNHRIRLGIPREELYRELIDRSDVPEFHMLIKALIQGSKLGTPVSKTLKTQALEIRKIRKEKVKEAASKASPKVTLVTTFVVMPSALLLIGGLIILNLIATLQESGVLNSIDM